MIVTIILDIDNVPYVCRTFENESIQINRLVASLDNLDSQGTITKQSFRLPLVGDLLQALGDITDPSQKAKVNLNNSIKGRILIDGFPRFEGSFFVTNAVQGVTKEVEMLFQGNETDLKGTLSNITMAELCAGESVLYNYTEIKQYFDDPVGYRDSNGYIFPIINFGQNWDYLQIDAGLTEYDFKIAATFKKCFELMPLVIATEGIDDLMNQAILLHNDKNRFPVLNTSALSNTGSLYDNANFNVANDTNKFVISFASGDFYSNPAVIDIPNNEYVCLVDGDYTFRYYADFILNEASSNQKAFQFFVRKNASTDIGVVWGQTDPSFATQNRNVQGEFTITDLVAGDRFSLVIQTFSDSIIIGTRVLECIASPAFFATSTVNVSANCPQLTAWDIVSTIVRQCNGQILKQTDGSYKIIPWIDWIDDNTTTIVLDNLIENNIDVQVKPFSVQGARSIRLGYKENKDFLSSKFLELTGEPFGQKLISNTGTEFAKNEIEIKLPVATIPHKSIELTNCPIPSFTDNDGNIIVGSPTILNTSAATGSMSWKLKSIFSGNSTVYTSAPFTGNWSEIAGGFNETDSNFGQSLSFFSSQNYPNNNLYERYWKKYLQETYSENSREVKINVKLSVNDIDGWQFNEKFYYKNTLMRLIELNGISLTSRDNFVSATFMKRFDVLNIDIAPFYPYNVLNSIVQWKDSADNSDLGDGNSSDQADLEQSAIAYGFFYDSVKDIATQNGQILIT